MEASVSEIHGYPPRPAGFEEPLFPTRESRRAVAEHLLGAPWLSRASDLAGGAGEGARAIREPVELRETRGRVEVVRFPECGRRVRSVARVLDRWREVRGWWEEGGGVDRSIFRVLLRGGAVVDLAREGSAWFLVGVMD